MEVGPKRNFRFGLAVGAGALIYLGILTALLL
jgi:hypothetical protein